jgi:hypothetical protein
MNTTKIEALTRKRVNELHGNHEVDNYDDDIKRNRIWGGGGGGELDIYESG